MKFKLFSAVILGGCISFAAACTVTTVDGLGGSGIGGDTSDGVTSSKASASSSKSGSTVTGATSSVTSTGSGGTCDDGTAGDIGDATCQACVTCTQTGACMTEWQAYANDPSYDDYVACSNACASGDDACFQQCDTNYPNTATAYNAAAACSVCQECTNNCNAAANCTAG